MTITPVNRDDREWTRNRYILWFGACAPTRLMIWADSLGDAFDEAVDWIADNAPGLLCDDEVAEEYNRYLAEGCTEDDAIEKATVDTSCGGNCGHYVLSWEWGIIAEDETA